MPDLVEQFRELEADIMERMRPGTIAVGESGVDDVNAFVDVLIPRLASRPHARALTVTKPQARMLVAAAGRASAYSAGFPARWPEKFSVCGLPVEVL